MRCKEKEDFILANYQTMNYDEIGKILGISRNTVQYYLTKNNIRKMERELTESEKLFINANYTKLTYRQIGDILKLSENHVKGYVNSHKLPKNRKFNDRYFQNIDSDIKAYYLGFIFADGWVIHDADSANYEFGMELQSEDKYILENLNDELGGVHVIKHKEPTTYMIKGIVAHHGHSDILRVYSKILVEDLMSHGIVERKTMRDIHPIVPEEYFFDFLRGYIDGDGCYFLSGRNKNLLNMHITCSSPVPLEWVQSHLERYGIHSNVYCESERKFRLYCTNHNDLNKLLKLMYHDNFSFCLSRKYEKIKSFLYGSAV